MRFGCASAVLLWLGAASVWWDSLVPIAIGLVMIVGLWVFRGLGSERPLY